MLSTNVEPENKFTKKKWKKKKRNHIHSGVDVFIMQRPCDFCTLIQTRKFVKFNRSVEFRYIGSSEIMRNQRQRKKREKGNTMRLSFSIYTNGTAKSNVTTFKCIWMSLFEKYLQRIKGKIEKKNKIQMRMETTIKRT